MADTLFQSRKLTFINFIFQLVDEHIEVSTLITEYHSDTERVIDDDEGESGCDGEDTRVHSFIVTDGSKECDCESGVRARHVPMSESIAPVEAMLDGVDDELDDLHKERDENRDEEHG